MFLTPQAPRAGRGATGDHLRHATSVALRSQRGFQPLKIPNWASSGKVASPDGAGSLSHDAGEWNVFYLSLHELPFADNRARCPVTVSLLAALPRPCIRQLLTDGAPLILTSATLERRIQGLTQGKGYVEYNEILEVW